MWYHTIAKADQSRVDFEEEHGTHRNLQLVHFLSVLNQLENFWLTESQSLSIRNSTLTLPEMHINAIKYAQCITSGNVPDCTYCVDAIQRQFFILLLSCFTNSALFYCTCMVETYNMPHKDQCQRSDHLHTYCWHAYIIAKHFSSWRRNRCMVDTNPLEKLTSQSEALSFRGSQLVYMYPFKYWIKCEFHIRNPLQCYEHINNSCSIGWYLLQKFRPIKMELWINIFM